MSTSLRDQLLKAGLVSEKQSKEAERQRLQQQRGQRQLPKHRRGAASEPELAAQRAQLAKAARDQELSRKQKDKADERARAAQIRQLVEQNRLPRVQTEELYNFVDGTAIRRIPADAATRARLIRGEIAIVRCDERYELVPAETAERIRQRDARAVIPCGDKDTASPGDDGYGSFAVPDDLMW